MLLAALVWFSGCGSKPKEIVPLSVLEQLTIQADEAWRARDFEEARRLYGMIAESFPGDPAREAALLRLAAMDVVLPGDGPDVKKTLELLDLMDQNVMTAGQAALREALLKLLDLYSRDREAIRMLSDLSRRQKTQLDGWELEAIDQEESLHQWRRKVNQANQRVEQMELELDKIRQEIKLLKDIDMMLQTETGEEPPPPPDEQ